MGGVSVRVSPTRGYGEWGGPAMVGRRAGLVGLAGWAVWPSWPGWFPFFVLFYFSVLFIYLLSTVLLYFQLF